MIVYLDTSSLIKLYIEESGSAEVERLVEKASLVCTSVIAYREARSALAGLCREGALTVAEKHALRGFDSLHLASFLYLAGEGLGEPVQFSSFDDRLNGAAQTETAKEP